MSRKKVVMSDETKHALAEDLGFADKVEREGWSAITSGEAGGMVRAAVERAEKEMVNKEMQIPVPRPDDQSGQTRISDREPSPGTRST